MKHLKNWGELLNEGKQVGILYHFTDKLSLIVDSEKLKFGSIKDDFHRYDMPEELKGFESYISTTRFYELDWRSGIRIVLDGTLISNKYTVKPFHYMNYTTDREWRTKGQNQFQNQFEEKILSKKTDDFIPLNPKYIKQIDILKTQLKDYNNEFEKLKKLGIPLNITDKYKPYKK